MRSAATNPRCAVRSRYKSHILDSGGQTSGLCLEESSVGRPVAGCGWRVDSVADSVAMGGGAKRMPMSRRTSGIVAMQWAGRHRPGGGAPRRVRSGTGFSPRGW